MDKSKYDKFKALDPFFHIVMKGLDGLVDGDHFWDAVVDFMTIRHRGLSVTPYNVTARWP
jgi:hypothetical protein